MRPVVERIAQTVGHRLCPGVEFVPRRCLSRDVRFRNSIRPHRPPLIVITRQPDFEEVGEAVISRDLIRRQVIVEIDDRLIPSEIVIEFPRRKGMQHEVVVDKRR